MEDCRRKVESRASSLPSIGKSLLRFFHAFCTTLLALLLPLSLLLLARFTSFAPHTSGFSSRIIGIFLPPMIPIFHLVVLTVALLSLVHACTGYLPDPDVHLAWVVLSILQISVGLGIEGTIAAGTGPPASAFIVPIVTTWGHRLVFFVGVYETMVFWSKMLVKKVVDDTVYGRKTEERWLEQAATGLVFGFLWLGMLREEVEGLILADGRGWYGLVQWLVGQLMVLAGAVKLLKWIVFVGGGLLFYLRIAVDNGIRRFLDDPEDCKV